MGCLQSDETTNRQTLNSISVSVPAKNKPRSPTNSDSDKDQTEKYPTQLLADYIVHISEDDPDCITNDYKSIHSIVSSSSWFSHTIITNQSVETLEVLPSKLAFESGSFFVEQLKNLNVTQKDADTIKKSVQHQVEIIHETEDNASLESLSHSFYCHLSPQQGETSYIGIIIYGFVASKSTQKMKLICCGHCEQWQASTFRGLSIQNDQAKQIKHYIIHQLSQRVGAANYVTKSPSDATEESYKPSLAVSSASLDLKQFHMNMSRREVVKLMGLPKYPTYKVDDNGYLQSDKGLFISKQFVLLEVLGKGAFSKVYKAVDIKHQSICALKIVRGMQPFINAAHNELDILNDVTAVENEICIHLQKHFEWKNHHVFAFKLYGPSVLEVMSKNNFMHFPDDIVRSITHQLCKAIEFTHSLGIVFTDLKPENIIFVEDRLFSVRVDDTQQVWLPCNSRIKLIDFGSAVYETPKRSGKRFNNHLIQTRHYRAPEVVLGMAWNRAVDIWSIACVILELMKGHMVFITHCPIDHLYQIEKMIGPMPSTMIRSASRTKFNRLFHGDGSLKMESAKRSKYQAKALNEYFDSDKVESLKLCNFISRCLRWKAADRIGSDAFFKHEYFELIEDVLTHEHQPELTEMYTRNRIPSNCKC
eukprot:276464_1